VLFGEAGRLRLVAWLLAGCCSLVGGLLTAHWPLNYRVLTLIGTYAISFFIAGLLVVRAMIVGWLLGGFCKTSREFLTTARIFRKLPINSKKFQ